MADNSVGVLDLIYRQAMNGLPGSDSVQVLAEHYLSESGTLEKKADSLINWQVAKCGTTGFLTGLGGLLTLPVAVSADVGVNLYVQMRMAAAIAHMGGYDIHHDKVKTFVYIALCGSYVNEVLKKVGIEVGQKVATNFIKSKLSSELIAKINKTVAAKIVTKTGTRGAVNLLKVVPIVGGLVGAGFDAVTTKAIGTAAKKIFIENKPPKELSRIVSEDEVPDWAKKELRRLT